MADICIDVLPILEGAAQHRLTNTAKQAAGNLVDQSLALGVVEHLSDQDAGLGEVVVVGSRRVSAADHLTVGCPAVIHCSGLIRPRPAFTRSEEHTSELQSLMRTSYAVLCLKKKQHTK